MIALQIHITAGPQAGTRLQLTQSPATFGRAPENTLVLDLTTVSRNHGELRFEDGQWWLVNLSQNGTKVGRKRVTKKPRALDDGASIVIGDDEVFRVHHAGETAQPAAAAPATATPADAPQEDTPQQAPGTGAGGRSKLWIILGIWFAIVLGGFVLLYTTVGQKGGDGPTRNNKLVEFKSADDIRQILKREVERSSPNRATSDENLRKAQENYNRQPRKRYVYEVYRYYRLAVQYLPPGEKLGPEDQQRYDRVLTELSVAVFELYENAYRLHRQGLHGDALTEINQLENLFKALNYDDEAEQELKRIIERLRSRAAQAASRR